MIAAVFPDWDVIDLAPATGGHHQVYYLTVETSSIGIQDKVLKAPADEWIPLATEARLMDLLRRETSIPVPTVHAVVDDSEGSKQPYFLMKRLPGSTLRFEETRRLSDATLEGLAYETGEYLAELHSLTEFDQFGKVSCEYTKRRGDRPSPTADDLTVDRGTTDWNACLQRWVDVELQALRSAGETELADSVNTRFTDELAEVDDVPSPVLGRIDHGVHNIVFERGTGEIQGLLDWEFTLSVPREYDLHCISYVLSGEILSAIPGENSRRDLVRESMLDGYRSTTQGTRDAIQLHHEYRSVYEILVLTRAVSHLIQGIARVPHDYQQDIGAVLREQVARMVE